MHTNGESFMPTQINKEEVPSPEKCFSLVQQIKTAGKGAVKMARNEVVGQLIDFSTMLDRMDVFSTLFIDYAHTTLAYVQPGQYKLKDVHDLLKTITNSEYKAMELFDRMLADKRAFINNMGHVMFRAQDHIPYQRKASDTSTITTRT